MGRRSIIDYLIEGKQRGFSDEVLKDDLLDNGFDEQTIDDAFYQLHFQMNLQSRNQGKEVKNDSGWGEEFDEDSQKMPSQPSESEKTSAKSEKKKASGYNQGAIEGIKHRGWGLVLLFSIITFGIYGLVWLEKTTKELKKNTDSAPSPRWVWVFFVLILLSGLASASASLFLLSGGTLFSVLSIADAFLSLAALAVLIYHYVFYALAINELSGFSKAGIIILWILLPIVAMPVSQIQLNKFADDN